MPREEGAPDRTTWALAYMKQGGSDFAMYQRLSAMPEVEVCHPLHYLQMAGEKIAKAYRFRDTDTPDERLTTEHVAFSQFIESYLGSPEMKQRYAGKHEKLREIVKLARKLARAIEKLTPAGEREASPANAEYPWLEDGRVITPCEFAYPRPRAAARSPGRAWPPLQRFVGPVARRGHAGDLDLSRSGHPFLTRAQRAP
jgi:hypothetical protein